jgi:hypothetical protein
MWRPLHGEYEIENGDWHHDVVIPKGTGTVCSGSLEKKQHGKKEA